MTIKPTRFVDRSAVEYEQKRGVKDNPSFVLNKTNNLRGVLLLNYIVKKKKSLHVKVVRSSFPSRFKGGLEGSYCLWDIYSELN